MKWTAIANFALVFATFLLVGVGGWQGLTAVNTLSATLKVTNDDAARLAKEDADKKVYDWQKFMVYKIVADGSQKQKEPIDFDYIRAEYLKAAEQQMQNTDDSGSPRLKGKDISDDTLRKILMDLHMDRVVYVMHPGQKYMIEDATFNPEGPRLLTTLAAERYAHDLLVTEPDRYTIDQLTIKIAEQNHLDQADCRYALDQLLHACLIKIGDGGKVSLNLMPMGK